MENIKYYTINNPPFGWNKHKRKALLYLIDFTNVFHELNVQWFSEEPWDCVLCSAGSGPYLEYFSFLNNDWKDPPVLVLKDSYGKEKTW